MKKKKKKTTMKKDVYLINTCQQHVPYHLQKEKKKKKGEERKRKRLQKGRKGNKNYLFQLGGLPAKPGQLEQNLSVGHNIAKYTISLLAFHEDNLSMVHHNFLKKYISKYLFILLFLVLFSPSFSSVSLSLSTLYGLESRSN